MKHKCDGCRYKGEHQEMMFRPMGVCNRGANLLEAIMNYEAEKCPYQKTNADLIREMSDDELARFFADKIENEYILSQKRLGYSEHTLTATQIEVIRHNCYCIWMKWLKQPAED